MSFVYFFSFVLLYPPPYRRKKTNILPFFDAPSHLYKRLCPSVCRSVRPSVCPSSANSSSAVDHRRSSAPAEKDGAEKGVDEDEEEEHSLVRALNLSDESITAESEPQQQQQQREEKPYSFLQTPPSPTKRHQPD